MLLTKKTKFSVSESQLKENVMSPDGVLLIKMNFRYPDIKCNKKDPLEKYAKRFYENIVSAFSDFVKKELSAIALSAYKSKPEQFLPYSALIRFEKTFLDENYLSMLLDISVSDGFNPPRLERKTQVWERKYGTKCRCSYFISKKQLESFVPEDDKKRIDRELFVLRDNGLEFFIRNDNVYTSFVVPSQKITKK